MLCVLLRLEHGGVLGSVRPCDNEGLLFFLLVVQR